MNVQPIKDNTSKIEIINHLIKHFSYESYLEIGVRTGSTYKNIDCKYKTCVDPNSSYPATYKITSDSFFEINKLKYDIIFIDGLHTEEQVIKDIDNSLSILNDNGTIVVHDCNPPTKYHQRSANEYNGQGQWNGTVWKGFSKFRCEREDLSIFTVDTDWGCGVIRVGEQDVFKLEDNHVYDWEFLDKNRKVLLNLITVKEFFKLDI